MTDSLGSLQQLVMLAVLRLPGEAYGAQIQLMLEETVDRTVTIGSIYVTMDRLEQRGLVRSWLGAPTTARGGPLRARLRCDGSVGRERFHRQPRARCARHVG